MVVESLSSGMKELARSSTEINEVEFGETRVEEDMREELERQVGVSNERS